MFDDWGRGDFSRTPPLFSEDVRFSATQPEGQVHETGPEGVARFMRRFLPEWELYSVELHELEDLGGGRYVATATQHGIGKTSRLDITSPVSIAIRIHRGKIAFLGFFMHGRDDALEALA